MKDEEIVNVEDINEEALNELMNNKGVDEDE